MSNRRAASSRTAQSRATGSTSMRLATKWRAAADASSSHWASSTTASTGHSSAAAASRDSAPMKTWNRSPVSPTSSANATRSAVAWGAGIASSRCITGVRRRWRAAKGSGASDSMPEVRSVVISPAAWSRAWASREDLPAPASPRTARAAPLPARAEVSSSAIAACSVALPCNDMVGE